MVFATYKLLCELLLLMNTLSMVPKTVASSAYGVEFDGGGGDVIPFSWS